MHTRHVIRTAAALVVAVLAASCSGGGDGKSPPPTHSSRASAEPSTSTGALTPVVRRVQTAVSQQSGGTVDVDFVYSVYGIYRQGAYSTLLMSVQVPDSEQLPSGFGERPGSYLGRRSPLPGKADGSQGDDAFTLVDPNAGKAYLVALDAKQDGDCLCPSNIIVSGHDVDFLRMTFAAPPSNASTMDALIPNIGYFPGIPVTTSSAPSPTPMEDTASTSAAARADVVDIDGPVADLDLSVTRRKDKVVLAADVLFAFNKATLTAKAKSRIAEAAAILRQKAHGQVQVNGYTDSKGSNSYNLALSQRRAAAVQKALAPQLKGTGITLVPKGHGEADPVAPNTVDGHDNAKGRALNRRVEIVYHQ